jgi:flagellar hook-length control protein FliK
MNIDFIPSAKSSSSKSPASSEADLVAGKDDAKSGGEGFFSKLSALFKGDEGKEAKVSKASKEVKASSDELGVQEKGSDDKSAEHAKKATTDVEVAEGKTVDKLAQLDSEDALPDEDGVEKSKAQSRDTAETVQPKETDKSKSGKQIAVESENTLDTEKIMQSGDKILNKLKQANSVLSQTGQTQRAHDVENNGKELPELSVSDSESAAALVAGSALSEAENADSSTQANEKATSEAQYAQLMSESTSLTDQEIQDEAIDPSQTGEVSDATVNVHGAQLRQVSPSDEPAQSDGETIESDEQQMALAAAAFFEAQKQQASLTSSSQDVSELDMLQPTPAESNEALSRMMTASTPESLVQDPRLGGELQDVSQKVASAVVVTSEGNTIQDGQAILSGMTALDQNKQPVTDETAATITSGMAIDSSSTLGKEGAVNFASDIESELPLSSEAKRARHVTSAMQMAQQNPNPNPIAAAMSERAAAQVPLQSVAPMAADSATNPTVAANFVPTAAALSGMSMLAGMDNKAKWSEEHLQAGGLAVQEKDSVQTGRETNFAQQLSSLSGLNTQMPSPLNRAEVMPTQAPIMANKEVAADQLSERVQMMLSKNLKNIDIRLDPPELGKMHIRMNISGDSATVHFTVANQQVRDALEGSMPRLREMLAQQGVQLGETGVQQQNANQQQGYAAGGRAQSQSGSNLSGELVSGDDNFSADVKLDLNVGTKRDGISYYA